MFVLQMPCSDIRNHCDSLVTCIWPGTAKAIARLTATTWSLYSFLVTHLVTESWFPGWRSADD